MSIILSKFFQLLCKPHGPFYATILFNHVCFIRLLSPGKMPMNTIKVNSSDTMNTRLTGNPYWENIISLCVKVVTKGKQVNRGGDFGLEVLC